MPVCHEIADDPATWHYEIGKYYQSTSECQPKVLQNLTVRGSCGLYSEIFVLGIVGSVQPENSESTAANFMPLVLPHSSVLTCIVYWSQPCPSTDCQAWKSVQETSCTRDRAQQLLWHDEFMLERRPAMLARHLHASHEDRST